MNENRAEKGVMSYEVTGVSYNFGDGMDEPNIVLQLKNFKFGEGNQSSINIGGVGASKCIWLYLNKSTFYNITKRIWDGTKENAEKLGNEMRGKVGKLEFKFNI